MLARTLPVKRAALSTNLNQRQRNRLVALFLTCLWFIADLPYFMSYLPYKDGHDLSFHILRILGLAQGIQDGQFPVRIQTVQLHGFGYPVSIMYGDVFLYPAALLVKLGMGVKKAYVLWVFLFNLITILVVYYIAQKLFNSTIIALTGSTFLTLFPYRMEDIYLRSAVGEYTALFFFLLLLYGLFLIFTKKKEFNHSLPWVWVSVGCAGIIMSHILSVILVFLPAFIMVIVGLIYNHSARVWKQIGFSFLAFLGLSAAFLIPFMSYFLHVPMAVRALSPQGKVLFAHDNAVQPAELMSLLRPLTGMSYNNVNSNMPYEVGWVAFAGFILFCFSLIVVKNADTEARVWGITFSTTAAITLFLSTKFFPWTETRFKLWNTFIQALSTIQLPWRFIGIGTTLLLIVGCIGLSIINKATYRHGIIQVISLNLIILAFLEGGIAVSSFVRNSDPSPTIQQMENSYNFGIYNGEYLPIHASEHFNSLSRKLLKKRNTPTVYNAHISNFTKKGTTLSFSFRCGARARVELPLLMYPNYELTTSSPAPGLSLTSQTDGTMILTASQPVTTHITIRYKEPLLWRVSEVISALTLILMCILPPLLASQRRNIGAHSEKTRR